MRAALSQSKISRIESGRILPTVVDVERILNALEVPSEVANELLSLARAANVDYASWRSQARIGMWRKQAEIQALAESSRTVRQFLPAIPSGLIQAPEYARSALSSVVDGDPEYDVDRAVRARLESQETLEDEHRSFVFLLTEQAVRWRRAESAAMIAQLDHMLTVAERSNVDLAVVPNNALVCAAPLNVFVVYDDRLVVVELFSGEVALRDPRDVTYHLNLFDYFHERSLHGEHASEFLTLVRGEYMLIRD